jgi:hypothetical protein
MVNKKKFFIIGMRRSGTSILRDCMRCAHDQIYDIEFETHILRYALQCMEIPRYRETLGHKGWVRDELKRFNDIAIDSGKWHGIKFALNPGVYDMEWVYLYHYFPYAKFIFIIRNKENTFSSYKKLDENIKRGHAPWDCYSPFFDLMTGQFRDYRKNNPENSCIINYEKLVIDADKELKKAWNILGIV